MNKRRVIRMDKGKLGILQVSPIEEITDLTPSDQVNLL